MSFLYEAFKDTVRGYSRKDIRDKYHKLDNQRVLYYVSFLYEAFKDKLHQEIKTAEYKHTIKERGNAIPNSGGHLLKEVIF
jgi:hypothetical protein